MGKHSHRREAGAQCGLMCLYIDPVGQSADNRRSWAGRRQLPQHLLSKCTTIVGDTPRTDNAHMLTLRPSYILTAYIQDHGWDGNLTKRRWIVLAKKKDGANAFLLTALLNTQSLFNQSRRSQLLRYTLREAGKDTSTKLRISEESRSRAEGFNKLNSRARSYILGEGECNGIGSLSRSKAGWHRW